MVSSFLRLLQFVALTLTTTTVLAAPASPASAAPSPTVSFASTNPNFALWGPESPPSAPQPVRGSLGASIQGPTNVFMELENADLLAPPTTDSGSVGNAKWPFSFSKNRLQKGGWARQQNGIFSVIPMLSDIAGVDMRLEAGAIRELHWHTTSEWAYVLKGTTQISAVDQDGRNFVANVKAGDLWFFPPGIPHSLQATNDTEEGSEFLLIFPDGNFDENDTFLLTDWLSHVPFEVIQKNFQVTDPKAFSHIPAEQLYIFPSNPPANADAPSDPQGTVPLPYSFAFSDVEPTQLGGGTVKIADSRTFNISTSISVAEVTVEPGALRELHWHPIMDEWTFFLEGEARVTIFAAEGTANTFNYQAGDIAYVPVSMGHFVENTGNTPLKYLEIFNSDLFQDVSLSQWLALTPPALVKAHLGLDDATIKELAKFKEKAIVVPPLNLTSVNSTVQ
ncbi:oxalate decarboxylase [Marasmius fiardii PR-910]|nr:oxalate decarboxylase [Marasmius fiardii PR-910]